jgi:hypothetical protein
MMLNSTRRENSMNKILMAAVLCASFAAPAFAGGSDDGGKRSGGGAPIAGQVSRHCKAVMKHPHNYRARTVRACNFTPNGTR